MASRFGMHITRCHDLSLALDANTLRYPGDPAPTVRTIASLQRGDALTVSELTLNCHVGTHIDAPAHFCAAGARLDQLEIQHFCGPALVVAVRGASPITPNDFGDLAAARDRHVLLKTGNAPLLEQADFDPSYRTLSTAAAEVLAACRPLSVGFDYYSLDPPSTCEFPAHLVLARHGIPVFLPLRLGDVAPGEYLFVAMPLPLTGAEAAPVRPVLLELG